VKATEVNAGLAESNGRLLLGIWRDSLRVTRGLTACTPGSAPGPTLGNEYGKTLPLPFTGQAVVMPCGWESNRRSGVALAMPHRLQWFIHLRVHGLMKGHEHPAYTPHGVWHTLYLTKYTCMGETDARNS